MSPFLFDLLPAYGALVATAFVVGILVGMKNARKVGISFESQLDVAFWIVFGALLGARVLFIVVNLRTYLELPPETLTIFGKAIEIPAVLAFWRGGLVFYGGVIGAVTGAVVIAVRRRLPALALADCVAPALAIAHAFGRLGCFFAGCCYGHPGAGGFGAAFPPGSLAYMETITAPVGGRLPDTTPHLHPTQLYDGGGELLIFGLLVFLWPRKRYHGQIALTWVALYPVLRFVVEIFRGDMLRGFVARIPIPPVANLLALPDAQPILLSTSQLVGLLIALAAAVTLLLLRRKPADTSTPASVG